MVTTFVASSSHSAAASASSRVRVSFIPFAASGRSRTMLVDGSGLGELQRFEIGHGRNVIAPDRAEAAGLACVPFVHLDVATCSRIRRATLRTEGEDASRQAQTVPPHGGRAQVRGRRGHRLPVLRRAVRRSPRWSARPSSSSTPSTTTPRARISPRTGSRCAAAPADPTRAGISSFPPGADARTEVRTPLGESALPTTPCPTNCATSCWRSCATARCARWRASPPAAPSTCCTATTASRWPSSATTRSRASADGDAEPQEWREWELELAEGAGADGGAALLDRLANRLFDAGAEPAGHGSKLAKVLRHSAPEPAPRADDPVHRAVAEQVEELLVWDRAVRADAWDSVHQMRVVTRKIRSLLRASEESFGIDRRLVAARGAQAAGRHPRRGARRRGARREVRDRARRAARRAGPRAGARTPRRGRQAALSGRLEAVAGGDALRTLLPAARRRSRR